MALVLLGAVLGHRSGLPAGVLFGTMAGAGLWSIFLTPSGVEVPQGVRYLLQILVGVLVGVRVSRDSLRSGLNSLLPAALLTAAVLLAGVLSALVAVRFTGVDLPTALFAAVPGGMISMSALAAGFGADGASVVVVHLARVLVTISLAGLLLSRLERAARPEAEEPAERSAPDEPPASARVLLLALGAGALGGVAGLLGPVPAGGILGSLVGSAAVCLLAARPVRSGGLQLGVQVIGGGAIGLGISADFFADLGSLTGLAALVISTQVLLWVVTSYLFVHAFRYNGPTATFATAPGGMSEVIIVSTQSTADTTVVAFTHLVRLSAIVVVVPSLIGALFLP